jgi:hypothetical protein
VLLEDQIFECQNPLITHDADCDANVKTDPGEIQKELDYLPLIVGLVALTRFSIMRFPVVGFIIIAMLSAATGRQKSYSSDECEVKNDVNC